MFGASAMPWEAHLQSLSDERSYVTALRTLAGLALDPVSPFPKASLDLVLEETGWQLQQDLSWPCPKKMRVDRLRI